MSKKSKLRQQARDKRDEQQARRVIAGIIIALVVLCGLCLALITVMQ